MNASIETWIARQTGLFDHCNAHTLFAWQQQRAWQCAVRAAQHSAFYRQHLCGTLDRPHTWAQWQALPLMEASHLAQDPWALVCTPPRDISRVVTLRTSGTQCAKRVCFSREDLQRTVDFFAHGMHTMVRRGQRAAIFMRGEEPDTVGTLLQEGLARIGVSAQIVWPLENWTQAVRVASQAQCLIGFPAHMRALAQHAPRLQVETVLLSADYVPQSVVHMLQSTWHCRILTHYGMTEMGFGGGVQCLCAQGYHMREADFLFEIVDPQTGRPRPQGEWGEVVITTLQPRAMPLIRYRTGDLSRRLTAPCACGSTLPRLDKVMGRVGDCIHGALGIASLDECLLDIPEVKDYRMRKEEGVWHLSVYAPNAPYAILEKQIRAALSEVTPMNLHWAKDPWPYSAQKRRVER